MSFHIEWERLAAQAYDMLDRDAQAAIATAVVRLARQGIPDPNPVMTGDGRCGQAITSSSSPKTTSTST
jgi:hypothetical protein